MRPFRRAALLRGLSLLLLTGVSAVGSEDNYPEWESTDGRTLEARIVFVDGELVSMKRIDGIVFKIPLNRFVKEDQEKIRNWTPPPIPVPDAEEAVLVLETDGGRGSGFLVQENGRVWIYTNQHVVGDVLSLKAVDMTGKEIELGIMELAIDRDLARFAAEEKRGLKLADEFKIGDEVSVFGNSQGEGVITRGDGSILGLSATTVEVSSEIVSGNSGGPVLDGDGRVVGVSSFVTFRDPSADPTMAETRYEKPRRFALRLDQEIDFRAVTSEDYEEYYEIYRSGVAVFDEGLAFTQQILSSPSSRVMLGNFEYEELSDIVESHNKDVARSQSEYRSGMSTRSRLTRFSSRLIDNLEDAMEMGDESLQSVRLQLNDERFGWMLSEVERREKLLEQWRQVVRNVEETLD